MLGESKSLSNQNQHFIPKSFLNEFTFNRNGWFHELNIATKQIKKRHAKNACISSNYYDIKDENILRRFSLDNPRYLENSFTYENNLGKVLTKIRKKHPYLIRQEFQTIVEAYVSLKHRTPHFRKQISDNKMMGEILDSTIRDIEKEHRELIRSHNFNYDEFAVDFKNKTLNDKELPKIHHLTSLVETSKNQNPAVKEAMLKILSMNIIIVETTNDDYFFTSDNPGYSLDGSKMFNTNYGKFDKIHFPINSRQMILFHGFDSTNYINPLVRLTYVKAPSSFVSEVNRLTKLIADEKLFCENRDFLKRFRNWTDS